MPLRCHQIPGDKGKLKGYESNFPDSPPPIANVHELVHIVRLLLITFSKKSFFLLDVFLYTISIIIPPTCTNRDGGAVG